MRQAVDLGMCFWQVEVAELPSMAALIGQFASLAHIKKIGEGTFGEAFKSDQVTLIRWFPLQPPLAPSYPPVSSLRPIPA